MHKMFMIVLQIEILLTPTKHKNSKKGFFFPISSSFLPLDLQHGCEWIWSRVAFHQLLFSFRVVSTVTWFSLSHVRRLPLSCRAVLMPDLWDDLPLSKTDTRHLLNCQNVLCHYTSVTSTVICPCDASARSLSDNNSFSPALLLDAKRVDGKFNPVN